MPVIVTFIRLLNAESKAEKHETSDDEASRKILETRDDKILELESRLVLLTTFEMFLKLCTFVK